MFCRRYRFLIAYQVHDTVAELARISINDQIVGTDGLEHEADSLPSEVRAARERFLAFEAECLSCITG